MSFVSWIIATGLARRALASNSFSGFKNKACLVRTGVFVCLSRFLLLASFLSLTALGIAQTTNSLQELVYSKDDLGAVYSPSVTTIKLWAPTAKAVRLALFVNATNSAFSSVPMERGKDGIWTSRLEGDQDGKYYLYEITHQAAGADQPMRYRVNDPYARGCSPNTGRTLILPHRP